MITLKDDLSRVVQLKGPGRRIVSLVPSITETLFSLGAGGQIAGITDFCIHPKAEVSAKPKIGGTKNFFINRVLDLNPDLVIANAEENRKHEVERLEKAGLTVFVTFPRTIDGCAKMISDMAIMTGTEPAAQPILAAIAAARAAARAGAVDPTPGVLCPIWKNPYMTVNGDTYVDSVIQASGGRNVFCQSAERYPQFTLAEAARRQPDVILLPTEPYRFSKAEITEFEEMGSKVPAVRNRRIHIVEGELLSWYGPRLPRAIAEISTILVLSTEY